MQEKLNILFVSSGNNWEYISPIVLNQGESLRKVGLKIEYLPLKGKGLKGYLRNIQTIRKFLKSNSFDIIHAHYSLTAFIVSLAGGKPLVASLMGSDVKAKRWKKYLIAIFHHLFWEVTIVKSEDMRKSLGLKKVDVIPNGVDFDKFKPMNRQKALANTGWDSTKKFVLFAANPVNTVKNFPLAKEALNTLNNKNIKLQFLRNIPNDQVAYYYNSADVVLLTSLYEGSPNVIKESMACSRPIVATNVGDIAEVIRDTKGCFLSAFCPEELARKITLALKFNVPTDGRIKIKHLDTKIIAKKIESIYKSAIE